MTPQFDPVGYTKQPQIYIWNEELLQIFKSSYQTVVSIPIYDHCGGSNYPILTKNDPKY